MYILFFLSLVSHMQYLQLLGQQGKHIALLGSAPCSQLATSLFNGNPARCFLAGRMVLAVQKLGENSPSVSHPIEGKAVYGQ